MAHTHAVFMQDDGLHTVMLPHLSQLITSIYLLLPDTSFPFLQGLLARVLGLWLIDLLEHHEIDPYMLQYTRSTNSFVTWH